MSRKRKKLAGQRFGRLVVLYDTGERKNRHVFWHCRCDCGNEVVVRTDCLISGNTTSCGCYRKGCVAERNTTHGMAGKEHPVYNTWASMLQRCENPNDPGYKRYGGRGITVCDEWHDPVVFINWALANGWRKGLTLDRIDNDGNYEPDNCRWATRKEQARNKRNNRLITFNGKTQSLAAWAEELSVNYSTLGNRLNAGWSIKNAFTTSIGGSRHAPH